MNKKRFLYLAVILIALLTLLWLNCSLLGVNPPLPKVVSLSPSATTPLRVVDDYQLSVFADELQAPRMLRAIDAGLLVSEPHEGRVLLVKDTNRSGRADQREVLLDGLNRPHGVDVAAGWLYVAETDAVGRVAFDEQSGKVLGHYQRIIADLPSNKGHWTRTVRVGPDGWLYVTIGSSCNVCVEDEPERAAMLRLRPDGSEQTIFASGLRNSVDFDWSPVNGELYATDNGRDWLGDNFPPDELNRIIEGGFYGWPFANGNKVADPDFGEGQGQAINQSIAPVFEFRAHNAPLGIRFLRHQSNDYQHVALVALHGSWNRSVKDGYKVVSLFWHHDGQIEAKDFVSGFLEGEEVHGRPVGVAEAADGSIYISDDYAGVIYRLLEKE